MLKKQKICCFVFYSIYLLLNYKFEIFFLIEFSEFF